VSRDDARRAHDILEAIDAITVAVQVMNAHDGDDHITAVCVDAITYRVFTIGEATKSLSAQATDGHPDAPWSNIAKMRDLSGHHYYRRDPQTSKSESGISPDRRSPWTSLGSWRLTWNGQQPLKLGIVCPAQS